MRPTRSYRVHLHNGWLIDLEAEGMWPTGTQLEFTFAAAAVGRTRVAAAEQQLAEPFSTLNDVRASQRGRAEA